MSTASINCEYQQLRAQMKDGDVLLFRGEGLSSSIIQLGTDSEYSHAGVVAWWGERLMVLEAVGRGVIASPISYNLKTYHGGIDYFRTREPLSEQARAQIVDFARNQLGKEYATGRVLELSVRLLFNSLLESEESEQARDSYFCSEFVAEAYQRAGVDLTATCNSANTAPDQLAESPLLKKVGTLKYREDEEVAASCSPV